MLLNGKFYPKVKVLAKRLSIDPEKLNHSQICSNKALINLRLYIKENKLFSLDRMEDEDGVRSEQMKQLIFNLVQSKWKEKTSQLYSRIFSKN
jgi:hypothetical protein